MSMGHGVSAAAPQGNTLGKYRLIAELGQGGMAEVYLAVARGPAGFNKLCVIKQIRPRLAEDPDFLAMFLDEARLAARLSHPNVVQTNEVGEDGGRFFIAMEFLDGQPLNRILHRLGRDGVFPLGMHLRVLIEVLAGLHHAHELTDYDGTPLGVVHRDATPHNVFLTYDGQVKVVDFGIAKAMNSTAETRTGVLKGKVAYMAPEQARSDRVDRRADVFSVGVMLWEALTGRRLWKGLSDVAVLNHILSGDIPPPGSIKPDVPEVLEAICLKALAIAREERYATAVELASALEQALESLGDRTTARDAGRLIARHFEEDRVRMRGVIDAQLRSAKNLPTSEYQAVSIPQVGDSYSMSGAHPTTNLASMTPSGAYPAPSSAQRVGAATDPSMQSSLTPSLATPTQPASSARVAVVAAIVTAGAVALAGALWISSRNGAPSGQAASPPATPPPTAAPENSAPPAPREIALQVSASPPEARIFLDDKPLEKNPFSGKVALDAGNHTLRAEAEGYAVRTRTVTLDKDLAVELALEPARKDAADKPASAGPRRGAPPPPTDDPMKPGPKPKRTLDNTNPYAQ